jgi:hypothetical protein
MARTTSHSDARRFGGDGVPDMEPSATYHGYDMMSPDVRSRKRKGKRGGGRKHGRKSGKRE